MNPDLLRLLGGTAAVLVVASAVTNPSNWRSSSHLDGWLRARGIVGITGVDTRALTALIRDRGMPNAILANDPAGRFDREALKAKAAALPPMEGLDLVPPVTSNQTDNMERAAREMAAATGRNWQQHYAEQLMTNPMVYDQYLAANPAQTQTLS